MFIVRQVSAFLPATATLVVFAASLSWAQSTPSHLSKPDLHAGGANPSSIPNDAITEVTLPGLHLAGAHIETSAQCALVSPPVVTDNEIKMKLKGTRKVDNPEETCDLIVLTPGGKASTWIVVELTEAQQQIQSARETSAEQAKAEAFVAKSGKSWHLNFADGTTDTYTASGENQDAMPGFKKSGGDSLRIAVANDNTVLILDANCMRSGKLVGNEVKDGKSQGDCTPPGSWTATVAH